MDAQLLRETTESDLVSTQPEPTSRKIMRRSLLVVLAIVLGVGVAICHMALSMAGKPLVDALLFAAVLLVVAMSFARLSPERHIIFALSLGVPALVLAIGYGLAAHEVAKSPLWYLAPVIWLLSAGLGAMLGKFTGTRTVPTGQP